MENQNLETNKIIGNNISKYRKKINMTQLELADELNYSDKAVSKWERGDGAPDIEVLLKLAGIFGVTLNDLCYEFPEKSKEIVLPNNKLKHIYISILSFGLVWLIATIVFAFLLAFSPNIAKKWICFIYAIPLSSIVLLVLNSNWGKKIWNCLFVSIIIWGVFLSICLSVNSVSINWLFLIGVPLQLLTIVWYFFKSKIIERISLMKKHNKDNIENKK